MPGEQQLSVVAGDIALTSTRYEAAAPDAEGNVVTMVTAEVSRRQPDGTWRVVIDAPFLA